MNRKSTLNQKRSATISEFRFITEENTEANALLQQEQQQPQLKQDQSLLQQHKRTQSQTKLTKVLPYKVTRSKSVHAFQEYGKGFVGSPLMNSSIKSSQINLPQSKKLIKTNNTFATNSSNNFANSIPQQPSTSIAVASEELRLPVPPPPSPPPPSPPPVPQPPSPIHPSPFISNTIDDDNAQTSLSYSSNLLNYCQESVVTPTYPVVATKTPIVEFAMQL